MAGLKKFLRKRGGKKGSASQEDVRSNADSELAFGYTISKEKDLPKLHKAVWNRDATKVKQLSKKADLNQFDKENRLEILQSIFVYPVPQKLIQCTCVIVALVTASYSCFKDGLALPEACTLYAHCRRCLYIDGLVYRK